jgi:hypothetical protein
MDALAQDGFGFFAIGRAAHEVGEIGLHCVASLELRSRDTGGRD